MACSLMQFVVASTAPPPPPAGTPPPLVVEEELEEEIYDMEDFAIIPDLSLGNLSEEEGLKWRARLERAIPKMYQPDVALASFVGLEEVKEGLLQSAQNNEPCDRILIFGPTGCGKSHFARALTTQLKALLFTIDKITFHGWAKNLEIFTQLFADIARDSEHGMMGGNEVVILLLENFDWFYGNQKEMEAVTGLLNGVQGLWERFSDSKLVIVACSYTPWTLDKNVVDCFQKRVYLRPLNFQERKQLIEKKSNDLLFKLDMTDRELGEVAKRVERFAGWEICEMVERAFRLQCPAHIKRQPWICYNLRPFNQTDFEITLDRMTAGTNDKKLLAKFDEFNRLFGDVKERLAKVVPKFEDKAVQVEVNKRNKKSLILKFFNRIVL